jgi:hypothetical protein
MGGKLDTGKLQQLAQPGEQSQGEGRGEPFMLEFNYGWRILKGRKLHTFVSPIGLKHVRYVYILSSKKIFHENFHPWSPQYSIMP